MVVAVSSTANTRRVAPAQPALTAGETPSPALRGGRAPRPWAAALQRPATKILVAGGLTLAGWLLTGALSGSTATAAETTGCQHATASTVEHHGLLSGHHRKSHRETDAATCAQRPDATASESTKDTQPAEEPATEPATTTKATTSGGLLNGLVGTVTSATKLVTEPAATAKTTTTKTTTEANSSGDLLGGLVGGVLNVVGGTLNTVTTTVTGTLNTVGTLTDTLSHTVLAPLTQPPADNPDAPVLLPLDDILDPILGSGSNSGGVTVTVTGVVGDTLTPVTTTPATATAATEAATTPQTSRAAVVHLIEVQNTRPAQQEQPRDSGVHARNGGGDSTPGLPGGTSAPSAPAPSAAAGHDGPGGARHPFAVHSDHVTTTQLKLIGTSLDHDVDGAGREAALPTTSPD